jgi:hypothetical protein
METAVLVLQLANLALIGLLPRIFFRPGRLNLRWWLTAAPFFLTAVVLLLAFAGVIAPQPQPDSTLSHAGAVVSVPMSATSIALIAYAMGSHSAPVSLWHQRVAVPGSLVTHGAYGKVRHPFYLAFKAPHLPQIPAPRHDGLFAGIPPWRPPSYNEADVSDKPQWVQNLALQNSAQLDQIRIDQLEMLQAVDEAIGGSTTYGITGIMQHLRNLGVADDTIVVYFADNGWHWGEHRYQAKNKPYEESIRAPMFIRYPRLAPLPRVERVPLLDVA